MKKHLSVRQARFVEEYLLDLNGTQAAIRAGYSPRSASVTAAQLITKPKVAATIQTRMDQRSRETGITAERVLQELARVAFFDARKFFAEDRSLLPVHELDDDTAAALAGMETETRAEEDEGGVAITRVRKIKISDKLRALEMLGKHLKLFFERHEHTGADGKPLSTGVLIAPQPVSIEEWDRLYGANYVGHQS